ncbi:MAG: amidase [Rhodobacteraceae bacterium]|nr:amidase [Paracoccaceae bacterium]
MSDDLIYMTATETLARYADKSLSPVEMMSAQIARAEAIAQPVNPFAATFFDAAMDAARASEARWASGAQAGCLDGIAVAIKDESYIEGQPTTFGSLVNKDDIADFTSPNNERILGEGGIVHVRTTTPEYSSAGYCWSRLHGVTRNPWNTDYTPGGSSGGAGAALAAGATQLATGSDIGGSIRIPASCSGVVGYKPPYGRNPDDIPFNLDFYCHTGPMARSVADTILLQNVMCGPHPHDIASLYPKLVLPTRYPDLKGWKIALSMDLGSFPLDPDVRANTHAAAETFRALGATVEEVDIGWGPEVLEAALGYLTHLFGGSLSMLLDDHAESLTPYVREMAERARASSAQDFVRTLQVAGESYMKLGPLLERHDVLICPTNALPAVPAAFDHSRDTVEIDGTAVDPTLGWVMTTPFNMMSRCPVLSVPSGFAANGVPTGLQIVGPTYRDAKVFQAAMAFEAATGGWYGPGRPQPAIAMAKAGAG